jgi:integrase
MTADAIPAAATKSRHSVRRFRITDQLARKLWASLTTKPDEARLFAEVDNRSTAYWTIRYAGERAGIPFPVGNHGFRHTAASMMARAVIRQARPERRARAPDDGRGDAAKGGGGRGVAARDAVRGDEWAKGTASRWGGRSYF